MFNVFNKNLEDIAKGLLKQWRFRQDDSATEVLPRLLAET